MDKDPDEMGIQELATEYLRAVDEAEATRERILGRWAEEYYEPGYLDDEEWALVNELVERGETDDALMVVKVAIYRQHATEKGEADRFDDDWPAKESGE